MTSMPETPSTDKAPDAKVMSTIGRLQRTDRYRMDSLFPRRRGMGARSETKRRVATLLSLEPRLDTILYPEETIEYAAHATLNSYAEQYFLGIWAFVINRMVMLFTEHRVILVCVDKKGRVKHQAWQIPYSRMKRYKPGTHLGSIKFKLDDGRTYKFAQMAKRDRKYLRDYMQTSLSQPREERSQFPCHTARDPLCPACYSPMPPKTAVCPDCGDRMIDPKVPALMSLIVPGTGDLYLGHRGLALFEFAGFAFLLLNAVVRFARQEPEWVAFAVVLVIANIFDAAITFHIARKGAISRRHTFGKKSAPDTVLTAPS